MAITTRPAVNVDIPPVDASAAVTALETRVQRGYRENRVVAEECLGLDDREDVVLMYQLVSRGESERIVEHLDEIEGDAEDQNQSDALTTLRRGRRQPRGDR